MPSFIIACFTCMMGFNLVKDLTLCILTLHDQFSTWLLQLDKVPIWYTVINFTDHICNLLQCFCMLPSLMRELIRMIRACLDAMPVLKVTIWSLKTHILLQCTLITCQELQTSTTETAFFVLTWPQN